jgi:hypothetical protein
VLRWKVSQVLKERKLSALLTAMLSQFSDKHILDASVESRCLPAAASADETKRDRRGNSIRA